MKLTAIVRGRLYEYPMVNDDARDMILRNIDIHHSAIAEHLNGSHGYFISSNDGKSIVGHYIITKG